MDLENWSRTEKIVIFIIIPAILFLIYITPTEIKEARFILNKDAPSVESLFLSNYTHSKIWHFALNLFLYFVVIYLIMKLETNKSTFHKTFMFIFLGLPFLLSIITLESFDYPYVGEAYTLSRGFW